MGLVETEAIVLRSFKLAEADKIVSCLTKKMGVIRGVAHGARRLKNRYGASLEPFTCIALTYFEKEGRELVTLKNAEIVRSYFQLAQNSETIAALEYLSELALEFSPPHEPNEKLFRLMNACLEAIEKETECVDGVVRYYEIWILKLSGFLGDLNHCRNCRRRLVEEVSMLNAEGALSCKLCAHDMGVHISTDAVSLLRLMLRLTPAEWARHAPTKEIKSELAELTKRLMTRALEHIPRGLKTSTKKF